MNNDSGGVTRRKNNMGIFDDVYDGGSFFDTPRFRDYTSIVRNFIFSSNALVSLGDLKRGLGGKYDDRLTADALSWLADELDETLCGMVVKYSKTTRRVKQISQEYNTFSVTPSKRIRPADYATEQRTF